MRIYGDKSAEIARAYSLHSAAHNTRVRRGRDAGASNDDGNHSTTLKTLYTNMFH